MVHTSSRWRARVGASLVLAGFTLVGLLVPAAWANAQAVADPPSPATLGAAWDAERITAYPAALLDHGSVAGWVSHFASRWPMLFGTELIGQSLEGRSISLITFGRGPLHVLLWSQMHGDEPTATAALLDILEHVRRHQEEPAVRQMLERLTIHFVPMLNPDGAARFQRRNAQGIDVNRDALLLQTPEGRALKAVRDRLKPSLGFNLHNQSWRTSAGRAGKPASISLLAVAMDEARTETPGRTLAKKTCAVIRDAVESFAPGQVARYDDEFEVRAFGDNVTKWGTPVVLIETGPHQGPRADLDLQRLNFVAILSALHALASGRVQASDPARYESLPMNASDVFTILIRRAEIVTGTGIAPFSGDVGLASTRVIRETHAGARELLQTYRVDDLGDLRVFGGVEIVDANGMFLAPSPGWTEGSTVPIPDWTAFKANRPLAVGAAMALALLKPAGTGVYQVVRIFPAERQLAIAEANPVRR
jgi:hypothetical protein